MIAPRCICTRAHRNCTTRSLCEFVLFPVSHRSIINASPYLLRTEFTTRPSPSFPFVLSMFLTGPRTAGNRSFRPIFEMEEMQIKKF